MNKKILIFIGALGFGLLAFIMLKHYGAGCSTCPNQTTEVMRETTEVTPEGEKKTEDHFKKTTQTKGGKKETKETEEHVKQTTELKNGKVTKTECKTKKCASKKSKITPASAVK